jgi:flagellar hook assembly protein FlgD
LEQNYPNPFNPATQIRYTLAEAAPTRLEIYNLTGRKVRTLVSGHQAAGHHNLTFDGKDDNGAALVSGVYFYKLSSGNLVAQKKMLFMK